MIRNILNVNIKPVSVQATENAEPQSAVQPQPTAVQNAPATTANSANTWQRASLLQDGMTQQNSLHKQLAGKNYEHGVQEANQAKKKAEEEKESGSLWGTIFGGIILGTIVGDAGNGTSESHTKRKELQQHIKEKQVDIESLQADQEADQNPTS